MPIEQWLGRMLMDGDAVFEGLEGWREAGYLRADEGDLAIVLFEGEPNSEEAGWLYGTVIYKPGRRRQVDPGDVMGWIPTWAVERLRPPHQLPAEPTCRAPPPQGPTAVATPQAVPPSVEPSVSQALPGEGADTSVEPAAAEPHQAPSTRQTGHAASQSGPSV